MADWTWGGSCSGSGCQIMADQGVAAVGVMLPARAGALPVIVVLRHNLDQALEALEAQGQFITQIERDAGMRATERAEGRQRDLAVRRLLIISGMARGIDSCAHRGALAAWGLSQTGRSQEMASTRRVTSPGR